MESKHRLTDYMRKYINLIKINRNLNNLCEKLKERSIKVTSNQDG